jgi:hypothetical protein
LCISDYSRKVLSSKFVSYLNMIVVVLLRTKQKLAFLPDLNGADSPIEELARQAAMRRAHGMQALQGRRVL